MKLPKLKKKYLAIVMAAGVALGVGGIAAAYFGASGTGAGTGHAGPTAGFAVSLHTFSGVITPGGSETLQFAVGNKSTTYPEHASTVSVKMVTKGGDIDSSGGRVTGKVTGCTSTWFTPTVVKWRYDTSGPTMTPPVTYSLPPSEDLHVTVTVAMKNTPIHTQLACAGTDPEVTLTVAK